MIKGRGGGVGPGPSVGKMVRIAEEFKEKCLGWGHTGLEWSLGPRARKKPRMNQGYGRDRSWSWEGGWGRGRAYDVASSLEQEK